MGTGSPAQLAGRLGVCGGGGGRPVLSGGLGGQAERACGSRWQPCRGRGTSQDKPVHLAAQKCAGPLLEHTARWGRRVLTRWPCCGSQGCALKQAPWREWWAGGMGRAGAVVEQGDPPGLSPLDCGAWKASPPTPRAGVNSIRASHPPSTLLMFGARSLFVEGTVGCLAHPWPLPTP